VNAPRDQRTRLATSVVSQATSPETAPTLPLRVLVAEVVAVDSLLVVGDKSATSAQKSVILHVTAQRVVLVDTVAVSAVDKDMAAVVGSVVDVKEDRLATLVVATDTCLVIALKAKSVTTVAKSVISPVTAHPRPLRSALATSASNLATSKPNAPHR